jgi:hypothetical protein
MNYVVFSVKRPLQGPFTASRVSLHGSKRSLNGSEESLHGSLNVSIGVSTAPGLASMALE